MHSQRFKVVIYDKEFKIVTQYTIPPYLKRDYLENAGVMVTGDSTYSFPNGDYCQGCDLEATKSLGNKLQICSSLVVNRCYGYPVKLCVWCHYYCLVRYEDYEIDWVPAKIRQILRGGHKAKNVVTKLSM